MDKAQRIFFSGMVQGVGFRFTAQSLARRHKVFGWVKNLSNGKVEILAEGPEENIDIFLNSLKEEFNQAIADLQLEDVSYSGEFNDFQIKL
jgi:acylphosphatase